MNSVILVACKYEINKCPRNVIERDVSLWSRNFPSLEGKFRGLRNGVELGVSASNLRSAMVQEWKVGGHLGKSLALLDWRNALPPHFPLLRQLTGVTSLVGFSCGSAGKESSCSAGDLGSIPGLGRSLGDGDTQNGYPLQYSGLENSMNSTVHGVAKSRTRLSNFHRIKSLPPGETRGTLIQEPFQLSLLPRTKKV